jgi:adenine phosphoribosyltransferase
MSEAATANDERIRRVMSRIRDVPDFPKPGILFKDVTPLIGDGPSFRIVTDLLAEKFAARKPELIVGIESRGFIFGAALAERLGVGFVPVRKPGKLPYKTTRETYSLEYGTDALEMHEDAVEKRHCLIVDDLLATGGTAAATARLVERLGGIVDSFAFVIELDFLKGRQRLGGKQIHALIHY